MATDWGIMAGGALGSVMGLATAKWQDRRQIEQAKKLQEMQIAGSKEMGEFNQGLALEMWDKTNYAAQRQQMEKAGLNVGLMYGQGGPGGTTQTPTGSVSGQMAASGQGEIAAGAQLGLDMASQKAQIDLMKAQTEKTSVEAAKTAGVDTQEAESRIKAMAQQTQNAEIQNQILKWDEVMKGIEADILGKTIGAIVQQTKASSDLVVEQVQQAKTQNKITSQTADELIKQAKQESARKALEMSVMKVQMEALGAGITRTEAETAKIKQDTQKIVAEIGRIAAQTKQGWHQLSLQEQEIAIKMALKDFTTATPEQIKQYIEIMNMMTKSYGDVAGAGAKMIDAIVPF